MGGRKPRKVEISGLSSELHHHGCNMVHIEHLWKAANLYADVLETILESDIGASTLASPTGSQNTHSTGLGSWQWTATGHGAARLQLSSPSGAKCVCNAVYLLNQYCNYVQPENKKLNLGAGSGRLDRKHKEHLQG